MDVSFFQGIVENDFKLPPGHTAAELTPQLVANPGSTQSDLREISYLVLCGLIDADPGVNYSAEQLSGIGKPMTENLTYLSAALPANRIKSGTMSSGRSRNDSNRTSYVDIR